MSFAPIFTNVGRLTTNLFGMRCLFTRTVLADDIDYARLQSPSEEAPLTFYSQCAIGKYEKREIDDVVILRTDVQLLVSKPTDGNEPKTGDKVTIRGKVYRIQHVDSLSSNDVDVFFICQLRV